MHILSLSPEEKLALESKHKQTRDAKESDRIKAVLLRCEGWTVAMIAQALRIHQATVARHIEDFQAGKLAPASGGSSEMLSEKQSAKLIIRLEKHTYRTTAEIASYVKEAYGIIYSIPGMNKWLHRNGFSYKKPKGYPHKASRDEQEAFKQAYTALKKGLGKKDSVIFIDACHPSMATKLSYGWIKKGTTKPLETTASRTRINLVGGLDLSRLSKPIICTYDTVNSVSMINFLGQIRKQYKDSRKVYVVLDRAGYHRSAEMVLAAKKLKIRLFYLPAYSPNLNPIERLWKVMNEHARNNKFFKTSLEFKESIKLFFEKGLSKIACELKSRINDNFQSLDYAF